MLAVDSSRQQKGPRVMQDGTTILFGLPGVRVRDVERVAGGGRVVHVLTDDETAAACPACGVFSTSVRQRRTTRPRDLPYGEERLVVRWLKVQYACLESWCPRKAFTEQVAEVPAGSRVTGRLRRHVARRVAQGLAVSVAGAGLVSWPIAHDAWVAHAEELLEEPQPVIVLGIDETRRGRVRWSRCELTNRWVKVERFETNFVDLDRSQGLLGQASGRTKANVVGWLDERGQAWKDTVQVVAMDPCATYRAAVQQALPHARIVADHFHLVALANKAVTEVRRRVTLDTTGKRGTAKDPIWANRNRLLRGYQRLSQAQFIAMWNGLIDNDPSGQILAAWIGKEELRRLLATATTGGQRHDVAHRLHRFNSWCANAGVPELERLASTIQAWWPEVLGFLQTNVTNAGTEATNRTVKTAARTAYGFRNLQNQRRRVRFACTRQSRRVTAC
jgi:transposase